MPPSTTGRVESNNTEGKSENCRRPSLCLECTCPHSSPLSACILLISSRSQFRSIFLLRPNFGPTCKLPGLLSSGLPEHFASCITIACVRAGLHIGHDLLEGKGRFLMHSVLFPWPPWLPFMLTWGTNAGKILVTSWKALYNDSTEIISDILQISHI